MYYGPEAPRAPLQRPAQLPERDEALATLRSVAQTGAIYQEYSSASVERRSPSTDACKRRTAPWPSTARSPVRQAKRCNLSTVAIHFQFVLRSFHDLPSAPARMARSR